MLGVTIPRFICPQRGEVRSVNQRRQETRHGCDRKGRAAKSWLKVENEQVFQLREPETEEFFNRRQVRLFHVNLEYTGNYDVQISQSHNLEIALISEMFQKSTLRQDLTVGREEIILFLRT